MEGKLRIIMKCVKTRQMGGRDRGSSERAGPG